MRKAMKFIEKLSSFFNGIGMVVTMALMFLMTVDVIARAVFSIAILGAYEITEVMLLTIVGFSFANTQVKKRHIHVDVLVNVMPHKLRNIIEAICRICTMVFIAICCYAQFVQTISVKTAGTNSTVLMFPLWPFNLILSIGMFLFLLVLAVDVIKNLIEVFKGEGNGLTEETSPASLG